MKLQVLGLGSWGWGGVGKLGLPCQGLIIFSWATLSKFADLTFTLFEVSVFTWRILQPGSSKVTHSIPCFVMEWAELLFLLHGKGN